MSTARCCPCAPRHSCVRPCAAPILAAVGAGAAVDGGTLVAAGRHPRLAHRPRRRRARAPRAARVSGADRGAPRVRRRLCRR
eukprot:6088091-Prymnesium_polylepis.1